jgi:hypothetical protein
LKPALGLFSSLRFGEFNKLTEGCCWRAGGEVCKEKHRVEYSRCVSKWGHYINREMLFIRAFSNFASKPCCRCWFFVPLEHAWSFELANTARSSGRTLFCALERSEQWVGVPVVRVRPRQPFRADDCRHSLSRRLDRSCKLSTSVPD